jgi:hypothetical protein
VIQYLVLKFYIFQVYRLKSEIYRDYPRHPSLSCCTMNILTVLRETLTQYITFNRGGREESVLLYSSLAAMLSCIDPSLRIYPQRGDKISRGRTSTYILYLCDWSD